MKIIHIDMDAFYASVEQRDNPVLLGKPVVVGGDPDGRGVVAAASYEARRYGVRSAMPCAVARRLCPSAVFVPPNMKRYRAVSAQIFEMFRAVTARVEPVSLDEAYLDVTDNYMNEVLASEIARYLKAQIVAETGLTASAGVGPNKLVAKIASDFRKPDGLTVVAPARVAAFLEPLPVSRLWGVGPQTARRLAELGLKTIRDLKACPVHRLHKSLGSFGVTLHALAQGRDRREVVSHREPRSRSSETTFARDVSELNTLETVVEQQAHEVARCLMRLEQPGRTVTLKLRYTDFTTITRSRTLKNATLDASEIAATGRLLLHQTREQDPRPVRLIGLGVANLIARDDAIQLQLPWINSDHLPREPSPLELL